MDYKNVMDYAKEMAKAERLAEGEKIGEEKGGVKKAINVAKLSILQGLDNQTISIITDLSIKEIENLRK